MKGLIISGILLLSSVSTLAQSANCPNFAFEKQVACVMDDKHPASCDWFNQGVYLHCHPNVTDCCYDDQGDSWESRCAANNPSDSDCVAIKAMNP